MPHAVYVACETSEGIRPTDRTVAVRTFQGRAEFLRVNADYLLHKENKDYLPVGYIRQDSETGAHLVELPTEADSGTHRIWVPNDSLLKTEEAIA